MAKTNEIGLNADSSEVHLVRWIRNGGYLEVLEIWDDLKKAEERADKYKASMKGGIINRIKHAGGVVNVETFKVRS
jgi:hypothetical protein